MPGQAWDIKTHEERWKPKRNASDIPFQHFQEKTPPQNSEIKKQFSLYQQLWDRVIKGVSKVSFTETLAWGKCLSLRPYPAHLNIQTVVPTLNQPSWLRQMNFLLYG